MFDLFRSRTKAVRYLLVALMMLVGLSLLTYLIPSYDMGRDGTGMVVAEVGDEALSLREVQLTIQNILRSRQVPQEMLPYYIPQLIETMITDRALAYEAERRGFRVTDEDVRAAIQQVVPSLFQNGQFIGRDQYAAMLAQQNVTIAEFEADVRRQALVNRLRSVILEGVVVSPQEIEREFRHRNERISLEFVRLDAARFRNEAQASPEELRAHFEQNRPQYQLPERWDLQIAVLDQAAIEQAAQVSEADLRRAYDTQRDRFRTPERIRVRHILLTTTGKSAEEEKAIREKAESILKQVRAGGNFAALAKQHSDDPGSKETGGELPNWVTRGQTVPEFEQVAFSLKPNEISDLVKTQYGFHIIQKIAHEEPRLRPFEEARAELLPELREEKILEQSEQLANELQNALRRNPAQAEQIAQQFNARIVSAPNMVFGRPVPEIGVSQEFESALAGLRKGEVTTPVQVPGNRTVVAVVRDITPGRQANFEEVHDQVRDAVLQQKANALLEQRAGELAERARSMGELRKAAQSLGLQVSTSDQITRQGAIEGVGSANYVEEAFSRPAGTIVGPVSIPEGRLVARVVNRQEPDMSALAAERDRLMDEVRSRKARERNALFEDGLRQQLIDSGKIKIHQDVVNRLTASYRG